jgi:hypothetical protein
MPEELRKLIQPNCQLLNPEHAMEALDGDFKQIKPIIPRITKKTGYYSCSQL